MQPLSSTVTQSARDNIQAHLTSFDPRSPLSRLWEASFVEGDVLVLPAEAATEIAAAHPRGYHHGIWHLATQYETLCANALLTNSNPHAPGYQQPKSFSAWPRQHERSAYETVSLLRATLPRDCFEVSDADRQAYLDAIQKWHRSVKYISKISGHTRLDQYQLIQLARILDWEYGLGIGF